MSIRMITGDCREQLALLEPQSVHTCVTSPPYFGLRDYGHAGQIGLEDTPDAFVAQMVAVFREVRRVLRDDGTLWLNLGDSYANDTKWGGQTSGKHVTAQHGDSGIGRRRQNTGLKSKDLIGIPWAVAKALQAPFYAGNIKAERDRTWLAAMIDGEGTICGFHHIRKDDGRPRTGIHATITNSSTALLDEAHRIWPASRSEHERPGAGHYGSRQTWRWICHGNENKMLLMREMYPYLIAKRRQAMVAYNLLLLVSDAKRLGHSPQRDATREKRKFLTDLLSDLNQVRDPIMPSWLVEPPTVEEPGWYLRQDIIWSKPNPMPESVRDRCTKAHEYLFLLSKGPRYYFDAEAIKEPMAESSLPRLRQNVEGQTGTVRANGGAKTNGNFKAAGNAETGLRNKRSVWEVTTQPFKEAHFATYPPELIEPCILAGCPVDGTVLDPFGGAGTTGMVADRLQRSAVLIELNPEYAAIAERRLHADAGMFADVA